MSVTPAAPFVISHVVDAPRGQVYALHTQPEHLTQWLSPPGFHCVHASADLRVGGCCHYGLEGPRGETMWALRVFREIEPDKRLVYVRAFSDRQGGLTHHPMAPTWPLEMMVTEVFEDDPADSNRTRVTVTWQPHQPDELGNATFDSGRAGMKEGLSATFAQLDAYLAELKKPA